MDRKWHFSSNHVEEKMADVSLDDYISRKGANFRVQISNQNVQRNKPPGFNQGRSQIKNRLGLKTKNVQGLQTKKNQSFQINKPVSVTLKGITKITFDARDKLSTKPKDAREKLNQGKGTKFQDARVQISNLKAKHGTDVQSNNGDARMKITAKRQNSNKGKITIQSRNPQKIIPTKVTFKGTDSTRQIGNQGQITVQGLGSPRALDSHGQVTITGLGQGRPPGNQEKINVTGLGNANFVRTINNSNHGNTIIPDYGEPQMQNRTPGIDFSITRTISSDPVTVNPMIHQPIMQYQNDPYPAPVYEPVHTEIPVQPVYPDIPVQTVYQDIPSHIINQDIHVQRTNQGIHVQRINTVPPSYQDISVQRTNSGQLNYPEDYEEEDYYDYDEDIQYSTPAPVPKRSAVEKTLTVKKPIKVSQTIPKTTTQTVTAAVKRKAPVSSGGPLKLYKPPSETVPVPAKKTKISVAPVVTDDPLDDEYEETHAAPAVDVLSPLQGFKVLVSNLHTIVTQDDIIELFGAIGPMKKARLAKPGLAEIVYVQKDSALKAVQKYNNRELDGQPMQVKMLTSTDATVKQPTDSPVTQSKPLGEPLRLGKGTPKKEGANIDVGLLHKALFKTTTPGVNKPVTFTVKI